MNTVTLQKCLVVNCKKVQGLELANLIHKMGIGNAEPVTVEKNVRKKSMSDMRYTQTKTVCNF